jgi:hypothetical protein
MKRNHSLSPEQSGSAKPSLNKCKTTSDVEAPGNRGSDQKKPASAVKQTFRCLGKSRTICQWTPNGKHLNPLRYGLNVNNNKIETTRVKQEISIPRVPETDKNVDFNNVDFPGYDFSASEIKRIYSGVSEMDAAVDHRMAHIDSFGNQYISGKTQVMKDLSDLSHGTTFKVSDMDNRMEVPEEEERIESTSYAGFYGFSMTQLTDTDTKRILSSWIHEEHPLDSQCIHDTLLERFG